MKKYTALVNDVDHGRGYACVGAGNVWEFYYKPKTLLNNNTFNEKKFFLKPEM